VQEREQRDSCWREENGTHTDKNGNLRISFSSYHCVLISVVSMARTFTGGHATASSVPALGQAPPCPHRGRPLPVQPWPACRDHARASGTLACPRGRARGCAPLRPLVRAHTAETASGWSALAPPRPPGLLSYVRADAEGPRLGLPARAAGGTAPGRWPGEPTPAHAGSEPP
jgi:hypothetical protein